MGVKEFRPRDSGDSRDSDPIDSGEGGFKGFIESDPRNSGDSRDSDPGIPVIQGIQIEGFK